MLVQHNQRFFFPVLQDYLDIKTTKNRLFVCCIYLIKPCDNKILWFTTHRNTPDRSVVETFEWGWSYKLELIVTNLQEEHRKDGALSFILATVSQLGLVFINSNTWICFDLNHSVVAPAVCLGALSSWKVTKVNLHTTQVSCKLKVFCEHCIPLHPSSQQLWPAGKSPLKENIPRGCCSAIRTSCVLSTLAFFAIKAKFVACTTCSGPELWFSAADPICLCVSCSPCFSGLVNVSYSWHVLMMDLWFQLLLSLFLSSLPHRIGFSNRRLQGISSIIKNMLLIELVLIVALFVPHFLFKPMSKCHGWKPRRLEENNKDKGFGPTVCFFRPRLKASTVCGVLRWSGRAFHRVRPSRKPDVPWKARGQRRLAFSKNGLCMEIVSFA